METGKTYELTWTVQENETAEHMGSGGLPVYATPAMVCLMEKTAYGLAEKEGLDTVGTRLDISHMKACLPGTELHCRAEVTAVDGRKITFRVEVRDAGNVIGEGIHERFAIDPERFMSKLK